MRPAEYIKIEKAQQKIGGTEVTCAFCQAPIPPYRVACDACILEEARQQKLSRTPPQGRISQTIAVAGDIHAGDPSVESSAEVRGTPPGVRD